MYLPLGMGKKMMSFRFDQELMEHAKNQADKRKPKKTLTDYIEEAVAGKSNFKTKKWKIQLVSRRNQVSEPRE